jgi:hypothetical protein
LAKANRSGIHGLVNFADAFYEAVSNVSWPKHDIFQMSALFFRHERLDFDNLGKNISDASEKKFFPT